MQTVPDAILKWIGGRDDDSIGVEQHNDRTTALIMAGNKPISGAFSGGKDPDKGKDGGDDLTSTAKKVDNATKELSTGNTKQDNNT